MGTRIVLHSTFVHRKPGLRGLVSGGDRVILSIIQFFLCVCVSSDKIGLY